MTELRRPALLDPRRHHREQFDSGEAALDEWLRRYTGQNRRRDTAATWHRYANLGIGTALTAHVLATAVELNDKAACRAVVVTALNQKARAWWERLGFHPFEPDDPNRPDLYLLTSEIGATLKRAR